MSSRVVFIVATRNGKFKPMVADVIRSEGDNDSFLHIIEQGEASVTVDPALQFIQDNPVEGARVFLNPVKLGTPGMIWLSELEATESKTPVAASA
jgi:hypothetical protein